MAQDPDSIQLALTKAQAMSATPIPINILTASNGTNHTFTKININPVEVCTNYRFKLENIPYDLNDKCRIAVQSFDYIRNYKTNECPSVGNVYLKSIMPSNTYTSKIENHGTLALPTNFIDTFSYENHDIENNSMPLPMNIGQILQNSFDIFIDSGKTNFNNQNIRGFIDEDAWSMTLLIYEQDEFEFINKELDPKIHNIKNVRLI